MTLEENINARIAELSNELNRVLEAKRNYENSIKEMDVRMTQIVGAVHELKRLESTFSKEAKEPSRKDLSSYRDDD